MIDGFPFMNTARIRAFALALPALFVLALGISAAQAATVTSSALDRIEITPYGKPFAVELNTDQQFVAQGFTKDGALLRGITFTWSVEKIGTVTKRGVFTATKAGAGNITAKSGSIYKTIGIRVTADKATATNSTKPKNSAPATVSEQNVTQPDEGAVLGEQTTDEPQTTEKQPAACSSVPAWVWICILLAYLIITGIYLVSLGESRTLFWWVWPLLLTAALAALFWRVHCPGHQLWVPWLLGLDALLMLLLYLRVLRPKDFSQHPGTTTPPNVS